MKYHIEKLAHNMVLAVVEANVSDIYQAIDVIKTNFQENNPKGIYEAAMKIAVETIEKADRENS